MLLWISPGGILKLVMHIKVWRCGKGLSDSWGGTFYPAWGIRWYLSCPPDTSEHIHMLLWMSPGGILKLVMHINVWMCGKGLSGSWGCPFYPSWGIIGYIMSYHDLLPL
jgi:hypothetical protein